MAFACDSCEKTFKARYLLNRHLVTHSRVRNHLCPVCGEAFLQSSALNRHAASHEARLAYRCVECGKCFNRSSTRDVHQATHAEKKHVCTQCGKAFHQKSTLTTHELIHTETKPFQCRYCDESFRQRSNLRVHTSRRHRGESKTLINIDSGFNIKKDVLRSNKLRLDLKREDCTNSHKRTKRKHLKEACPFERSTAQVCYTDRNFPGGYSKVGIIGNCKVEAKNLHLQQKRTSLELNNSLQALENVQNGSHNSLQTLEISSRDGCNSLTILKTCRKDLGNSQIVAIENTHQPNSDVEDDEFLTEEYCSPIQLASHVENASRIKLTNSEVCVNTEKESEVCQNHAEESEVCLSVEKETDSKETSRLSILSTQHCRDTNQISIAVPDSETVCEPRNAQTLDTKHQPIHKNQFCVRKIQYHVHSNHSSMTESVSKPDEPSNNVLPSVKNFLENVFKSCRLATSLVSPLVTVEEQSTTIPTKRKVTPRLRSGDVSGSRKHQQMLSRGKASAGKKSEKLMYIKLFAPDKPVKEFLWSCDFNK